VSRPVGLVVTVDIDPPDHPGARHGDFQIPVRTTFPSHGTSRDWPTLTESSFPTAAGSGLT
jgi:hypothetical protein